MSCDRIAEIDIFLLLQPLIGYATNPVVYTILSLSSVLIAIVYNCIASRNFITDKREAY